ncbi:hypothetical protein COCCADRAFT_85272 [Bipolaris zeicola 26-R-13]|uniref:Uncharacterized protein n=1 Tax=Cochliobolus carbonum (strain 26-R-13) TaxID=930089 RepID=W6YIK2_COCC2|nr:uncharacterized protein COCCADRAFT_85272 [Bipolaris zeicola 26-R-13]EUC37508.1 hypothetical protein COCCADRAFT_85272 [Bipolaris zeicola 26-R-13]
MKTGGKKKKNDQIPRNGILVFFFLQTPAVVFGLVGIGEEQLHLVLRLNPDSRPTTRNGAYYPFIYFAAAGPPLGGAWRSGTSLPSADLLYRVPGLHVFACMRY